MLFMPRPHLHVKPSRRRKQSRKAIFAKWSAWDMAMAVAGFMWQLHGVQLYMWEEDPVTAT